MDIADCALYQQLLEFQNDPSRHELRFNQQSLATQAYIQTLALGLGLEFQYSTITESAKVTRRHAVQAQPVEDDFLNFLDLNHSSCQSSSELPNAHDLPPSAEVDWNEVFSHQDQPNLFSPQHDEPMFSFESAFPELDLPSHSFDENLQYIALPSFNLNPDLTNAIPRNENLGEQDSLFGFGGFPSDVPTSQAQPVFEKAHSFQDLRFFTPSPIPEACFDIRAILSNLGMSHYVHDFLEHGFDTWEAIVGITESDLDVLGVKLGHRRKLQQLITNTKMTPEVPLGYPSNRPSDIVEPLSIQSRISMSATSRALAGTKMQAFFQSKERLKGVPQNETVENLIVSKDTLGELQLASRRQNSRAGSMSSCASNNGTVYKPKRIKKANSGRGSTQEESYPGYQVWDSRSANSASSSISSAASSGMTGRRGPLSGAARAMANAIKAVKACWRCKFMRKPVSLSPPKPKCAC
jgi:hypothetical protein